MPPNRYPLSIVATSEYLSQNIPKGWRDWRACAPIANRSEDLGRVPSIGPLFRIRSGIIRAARLYSLHPRFNRDRSNDAANEISRKRAFPRATIAINQRALSPAVTVSSIEYRELGGAIRRGCVVREDSPRERTAPRGGRGALSSARGIKSCGKTLGARQRWSRGAIYV